MNDTTVYSHVQFTHDPADYMYPHDEKDTTECIATKLGNYDGVEEGSVEMMEFVLHELGFLPTAAAAVKDGFYSKMNCLRISWHVVLPVLEAQSVSIFMETVGSTQVQS